MKNLIRVITIIVWAGVLQVMVSPREINYERNSIQNDSKSNNSSINGCFNFSN